MAESKQEMKNGEKTKPKGSKIKMETFKDVVDGSILSRDKVIDQLPFILFLSLIAIIYISNGYHSQKVYRDILKLQTEVTDLRAESISVASDLMYISKQSEVVKLINKKGLNLVESVEPPRKLDADDE